MQLPRQSTVFETEVGEAEAIHEYFLRMQTNNPNLLYAMNLDDGGLNRNVYVRSIVAYKSFRDVIALTRHALKTSMT